MEKIIELAYRPDYRHDFDFSETFFYRVTEAQAANVVEGDRIYIKNGRGENLGVVVSVFEASSENFAEFYKVAVKPLRFFRIDLKEILEKEALEEEVRALEAQMQEALKEIEKEQKYKLLADCNPMFKEVYEKYNSKRSLLSGNILIEASKSEEKSE